METCIFNHFINYFWGVGGLGRRGGLYCARCYYSSPQFKKGLRTDSPKAKSFWKNFILKMRFTKPCCVIWLPTFEPGTFLLEVDKQPQTETQAIYCQSTTLCSTLCSSKEPFKLPCTCYGYVFKQTFSQTFKGLI